jgi:FkbM family methyltransferase
MSPLPETGNRVLVRFMHGLGDAVQLTVVLRHIQRYHQDWLVDVYSLRGKHSAFHGLCRRSYHEQEAERPAGLYAAQYDLGWFENYNGYTDRPNSKVTNCLQEVFHIPYESALGRYQVRVSPPVLERAAAYLEWIGCSCGEREAQSAERSLSGAPRSALCASRYNAVIFHYQGNTSGDRKNLAHEQVRPLLELCLDRRYVPIILDWDRRSPLFDNRRVFNPGVHPGDLWGGFGSGDAETIAALISLATAFIGVDSGPGKCASATDTPALICWTRMHPVQFHDPAPNTIHLVPHNHHDIPPARHAGIADYFQRHYRFWTYAPGDGRHLTQMAARWLANILGSANGDRKEVERSAWPLDSTPKDGLAHCYGFWVPEENPIQSWTIIEDVYQNDAYKTMLRPKKEGPEYVLDVGANIGAFSKLWHERNPEAKIACVEVNKKLLAALEANVGGFATIIPKACHYGKDLRLLDAVCPEGLSIGGSRVVGVEEWQAESSSQYLKTQEPVETITLEEIQEQLGWPRIDFLKLDCEGSEYSILENADLSRIGTMFVESHGAARWRALVEKRFQGWDIGHMSRSACREFEVWHLVNPNQS